MPGQNDRQNKDSDLGYQAETAAQGSDDLGYVADQSGGAPPKPPAPAAPMKSSLPQATISAGPKPSVAQWFQDAQDDIKDGGDRTALGSLLKFMGAKGVYNGNSKQVGDFMASLPLGLMRAGQGAGEIAQGKISQGAKDAGLGALQAATIPSTFFGGPEVGEVGQAGLVEEAGNRLTGLFPSTARAGAKFDSVMSKAGNVPINYSAPGDAALQIQTLAQRGGSMPKVVRDFLTRATDPNKGPMTFSEARDFYSNASRLSADEANRLTPTLKKAVGDFRAALDQALTEAAGTVGQGKTYQGAMNDYRTAMGNRAWLENARKVGAQVGMKAATGAGIGAGVGGADLLYHLFFGSSKK
jgi:hypothetical protein